MKKNIIYLKRKEHHLTLEEVAKAVGVSKSTVAKWETGYIENMKRDKIALLADVLKIDPIDLIKSDDPQMIHIPVKKSLTFNERIDLEIEDIENDHMNQIVSLLDKLSYVGQKEAINRVKELTQIDKYKRKGSSLDFLAEAGIVVSAETENLLAAHSRTDTSITEKMVQHDNDIMDNDSEWE